MVCQGMVTQAFGSLNLPGATTIQYTVALHFNSPKLLSKGLDALNALFQTRTAMVAVHGLLAVLWAGWSTAFAAEPPGPQRQVGKDRAAVAPETKREKRRFSDLLQEKPANGAELKPADVIRPQFAPWADIAQERLARAGVRRIRGQHLTLYTDVGADPEIDELVQVFDSAVPQWCDYFGIRPETANGWQVDGILMKAKAPFRDLGLLPEQLPDFLHGYASPQQIWLLEQPSAYYRRHLVLHEGTHAFMAAILGGNGPPWYSEGIAELFGTHAWSDGKLAMRIMPRRREDLPDWGRIKLIKTDVANGRGLTLREIMQYGPRAHLKVEPYGWSWAASYFLENHPATQQQYRALRNFAPDTSPLFSTQFLQRIETEEHRVNEDWRVFIMHLDYGFDLERELVTHAPVKGLPAEGISIVVSAEKGWQSSGIRLDANRSYQIESEGQFLLRSEPSSWPCEGGGISLHYHRGFPLGALIGAICGGEENELDLSPLVKPGLLGVQRTIRVSQNGVLFLKINDWPWSWRDNEGELRVRIRPAPDAGRPADR